MEYICVFECIGTLHLFPQIYSNLPIHKMKWNSFLSNLLPKLYSNIICKNIVNIFQQFEVGHTQTCTSLESSTMWHPKRGHHSVFSLGSIFPPLIFIYYIIIISSVIIWDVGARFCCVYIIWFGLVIHYLGIESPYSYSRKHVLDVLCGECLFENLFHQLG